MTLACWMRGEEHGVGKIRARDLCGAAACQREREIACAAAKIERARVGPLQDWLETPGGSRAPHAIEFERQQMIQEVVTRRDFREHLADFPRSVRFGLRAFGASSFRGSGSLRHWPGRNRRRNEGQSAPRARLPPKERDRTTPLCRCVASAQIEAGHRASSYRTASLRSMRSTARAAMAA